MGLDWDQLNRSTLERQGLANRWSLGPEEALGRLGILQAQEPAGIWLALAARTRDFDPGAVDRAIRGGQIVRGTQIRITLGASRQTDYSAFHRAMDENLRGARVHDRRFAEAGCSAAALEACLAEVLALCQTPQTSDAIEDLLARRLGVRHPRLWWALKTFAPLVHVPDGAPWLFGPSRTFRTGSLGPLDPALTPEQGTQALLVGYLEAFGPASAADFARFTMLRMPVVRAALQALDHRLVRLEGPVGPLFDLAGRDLTDASARAPARLLPLWDQTLLAYTDPARMFEPGVRDRIAQVNGDLLPAVLVGGRACGVWRLVDEGVEVTVFRSLTSSEWDEVADEARALKGWVLERDPRLYGRYHHWWTKGLGTSEVRVF